MSSFAALMSCLIPLISLHSAGRASSRTDSEELASLLVRTRLLSSTWKRRSNRELVIKKENKDLKNVNEKRHMMIIWQVPT